MAMGGGFGRRPEKKGAQPPSCAPQPHPWGFPKIRTHGANSALMRKNSRELTGTVKARRT